MNCLLNQLFRYTCQSRSYVTSRRLFALIAVSLSILACASVPHTGRRQLNFVSDHQLNALGLKAFQEIVSSEQESRNQRLGKIAERVGARISKAAEALDKPDFAWDVRLIEKDVPNAVCLPGGKIIIFTGILPYAKNEAGLAAIVGHEVAHAVARHGGERLSQSLSLRAALALGSELWKKRAGKLTRQAQQVLAALGLGAEVGVLLPYTRLHEEEADEIGQIYMAAAGYDPRASIGLWERMGEIKKPPIPVWLSTHPSDKQRIADLKAHLPNAMRYYQDATERHGLGSIL